MYYNVSMIYAAIAIIVLILIIIIVRGVRRKADTAEIIEAGRQGEKTATAILKKFLRDDDYLLTNVSISFDGKQTELDDIIINKNGVFIFEVKNYNGYLAGSEDDFEWQKYKVTDAGNVYEKPVKNPIRQVKRQIYILHHFLDQRGVNIWVEGYVMLLHGRSPVASQYVLKTGRDIDRAIHTPGKVKLAPKTIKTIINLLK